MFNSTIRKLALRRQSIRRLTKDDLRIVVGGNKSTRTTSAYWHLSNDCPLHDD